MKSFPDVHFTEEKPLAYYETIPWNVNESRLVEFFPDVLTPVYLVSTSDANFSSFLLLLEDNSNPIALDLEWEDELCLLQFCSTKCALIVRHPNGTGNQILKQFLQSHKFYAKGASNDKRQLMMKFGSYFEENIEDISKTRLVPYKHSENFMEMTLKFAGKPTAVFKDIKITKSHWNQETLTMRQVLYAAFDVVALFHCYPNYPPPIVEIKKPKVVNNNHHNNRNNKPKDNLKKKFTECDKKEKVKVVMKTNYRRKRYCYVIHNYWDCAARKDLYQKFSFIDKNLIDFISCYPNENGSYQIFISLFEDVISKTNVKEKIIRLPFVDPDLFSDDDIFFFSSIPKCFKTKEDLDKFLYVFQKDHKISVDDGYVLIEMVSASASHILNCFLPYITINGEKIEIYNFPFFLNSIFVQNLPSNSNDKSIQKLFSNYGTIKSVEIQNSRNENDLKSAIIHLSTDKDVEESISAMNYKIIENNEILVSRYTNRNHFRIMRKNILFVQSPNKNSKEISQYYSKYGKIYQAYYDKLLDLGVIQFYNKKYAIQAEKEKEGFIMPEGTTLIIRDISCSVTDEEIIKDASKFGKVLSLFVRVILPKVNLRNIEITFDTIEAVNKAKEWFHQKIYDSMAIKVTKYKGDGNELPIWKIESRNNWVVVNRKLSEIEIFEEFYQYGDIIDFNITDEKTFIMFYDKKIADYIRNEFNLSLPSISEFALYTNNCIFETEMVILKQNEIVEKEIQKMAIVIDPMPNSFSEQTLKKYCPTCYYSFVVLPSTLYTNKRRAIIYPDSYKMTKRIFAYLRDKEIDGQNLDNMVIMKKEEVPNTVKISPVTIIIDPLPEELYDNKLKSNIIMEKEATIQIIPSSSFPNQQMAIILPKEKSDCSFIIRSLHRWRLDDGSSLHIKKIINDDF